MPFQISDFITYALSLMLAAILPGPGMLSVMFITMSQNYKNALFMLFGLMIGDLFYLIISIFWLNSIQRMNPHFLNFILIFSCIYLLYIACKMWNIQLNLSEEPELRSTQSNALQNSVSGLLLTLSNPKTIAFYLALVPAIFHQNIQNNMHVVSAILTTTLFILLLVGSLYIFFASQLKKYLNQIFFQRLLFRSTAIVLAIISIKMIFTI